MTSVYFGEGGKLTWRWFVPVMPRFGDVEAICGYCVQYCNVCCVCGYSLCGMRVDANVKRVIVLSIQG